MPKAKPVSLHPLSFDDALKALIRVDPEHVGLGPKRSKPSSKRKSVTKSNPKSK
jgi:hypothetical protein